MVRSTYQSGTGVVFAYGTIWNLPSCSWMTTLALLSWMHIDGQTIWAENTMGVVLLLRVELCVSTLFLKEVRYFLSLTLLSEYFLINDICPSLPFVVIVALWGSLRQVVVVLFTVIQRGLYTCCSHKIECEVPGSLNYCGGGAHCAGSGVKLRETGGAGDPNLALLKQVRALPLSCIMEPSDFSPAKPYRNLL